MARKLKNQANRAKYDKVVKSVEVLKNVGESGGYYRIIVKGKLLVKDRERVVVSFSFWKDENVIFLFNRLFWC